MDRKRDKRYVPLIYAVLAAATLFAYEQVRRNEFVYDDVHYITNNPPVQAGITRESFVWAFTTSHQANWHPLTWLSHMLDCELFGLNPLGHHLPNVFLHIINSFLLFWVLKRMTGAVWRSAFVAAVFALHPLRVESVAWAAERKDVLSGFFWMVTMAAYARYVERPHITRYLPVVLSFALGLMAKPMLVTLPFVLLLLDYWPLGRFRPGSRLENIKPPQTKIDAERRRTSASRLVAEKVPLFVLVAMSSVVTFVVQRSGGAMSMMGGGSLTLDVRVLNALVSYLAYIGKTIYPSGLAVFYPYPTGNLPLWKPIVSAVILAWVSLVVVFAARRRRYLVVGWLWYLGTLVPVIGLVQVGAQAMADRYTYLPLIGIVIMVTWGVSELVAKWNVRGKALGAAAAIVLVALLACTRTQVGYWRNSFTLYGRAIEVTDDNYAAYYNLARAEVKTGKVDEAVAHLKQAVRIVPENPDVHCNLGVALGLQNNLDEAIAHLREAVRIKPDFAKAHNNLGIALARRGDIDEAARHCTEALRIQPDFARAHYILSYIRASQGQLDEALEHCNEALRIQPDLTDAYELRERLIQQLGLE
jgi:Flp pilus assembly protein TadD